MKNFLRGMAQCEWGLNVENCKYKKPLTARRNTTPTHCPLALLRIFTLSTVFVNIF
jgi:hypothetical protein